MIVFCYIFYIIILILLHAIQSYIQLLYITYIINTFVNKSTIMSVNSAKRLTNQSYIIYLFFGAN